MSNGDWVDSRFYARRAQREHCLTIISQGPAAFGIITFDERVHKRLLTKYEKAAKARAKNANRGGY